MPIIGALTCIKDIFISVENLTELNAPWRAGSVLMSVFEGDAGPCAAAATERRYCKKRGRRARVCVCGGVINLCRTQRAYCVGVARRSHTYAYTLSLAELPGLPPALACPLQISYK